MNKRSGDLKSNMLDPFKDQEGPIHIRLSSDLTEISGLGRVLTSAYRHFPIMTNDKLSSILIGLQKGLIQYHVH